MTGRKETEMEDKPWIVIYTCCGRDWSAGRRPSRFATWETADQHRRWYMDVKMPGHDRVAFVKRDPA